MDDLSDLYQQVILDHHRSPRNCRKLERANRSAEGYNPLCGDRVHLTVDVDAQGIRDIGFEGSGCAISRASASLMTEAVKGKTLSQVQKLFEVFHRMLTSEVEEGEVESIEKLAAFAGVREFPVRVKCATLAWHTLRAALEGEHQQVSTE